MRYDPWGYPRPGTIEDTRRGPLARQDAPLGRSWARLGLEAILYLLGLGGLLAAVLGLWAVLS